MTTAKDLFMVAVDLERSVGRGDLSLALAGAELIDLIGAGAVALDGDRIVPGGASPLGDRFLGIDDERSDDGAGLDDEAVVRVVAAVHDAVMELEAVRQRRTIENAAFANLWRGP